MDTPPGKHGRRAGDRWPPTPLECANYVVRHYGIHDFLEDIDAGRQYWREDPGPEGNGSFIHRCLGWLANEGFRAFMSQYDLPKEIDISNATAWRNRYVLRALMG